MQTWKNNQITLHGTALDAPTLSHTSHDMDYFSLPLEVARLSGVVDTLLLLLPRSLVECQPIAPLSQLSVEGEVRSYNNRSGVGRRLLISVYGQSLQVEEGTDDNRPQLEGSLCKPPVYRHTPLGRDICDLLVAVHRRYGRTDYLPCIAWGSLAVRCGQLEVGDPIALSGRLQSRTYTKRLEVGVESRTAYEISIMNLND